MSLNVTKAYSEYNIKQTFKTMNSTFTIEQFVLANKFFHKQRC